MWLHNRTKNVKQLNSRPLFMGGSRYFSILGNKSVEIGRDMVWISFCGEKVHKGIFKRLY
jgi:hypothetical protein